MLRRLGGRQVWIAGVLALVGCGSQATGPVGPAVVPVVTKVEAEAPAAQPEEAVAERTVAVDASERFIVPESEAAKFYVGHHAAASGYFTPGEDEVRAFEHDLPAFLAGSAEPRARAIVAALPGYRRQFVGVAGAQGRRIFGNYFCGRARQPATVPVIVDDGGDCYFNVMYEPGGEEFSGLSINGDG